MLYITTEWSRWLITVIRLNINSYTPLSLVIVFAQVRSFDYLQILGFRRCNARAQILQIGFQRAGTQCASMFLRRNSTEMLYITTEWSRWQITVIRLTINSFTPLSLVIVLAQVRSFDYLQILSFWRRNARAQILQICFQRLTERAPIALVCFYVEAMVDGQTECHTVCHLRWDHVGRRWKAARTLESLFRLLSLFLWRSSSVWR